MSVTGFTHSSTNVIPRLVRNSLTWFNIDEDTVQLSVAVRNFSMEPTGTQKLIIEAAPFGAFIPHTPIGEISIGALRPMETRTLTTQIPLSDLNRVAPTRLDAAEIILRHFPDARVLIDPTKARHWIGNFNVYFEDNPRGAVERHCAFELKVPAETNVVGMFILFSRTPSDFAVSAKSTNPEWKPDCSLRHRMSAHMNVVTPSIVGSKSTIAFDVERKYDRKVVPVEFDFETVNGWGESVGCTAIR